MIRFPARTQLDLDPWLDAFLVRLDQPQPALAAREERGRDLLEVLGHRRERLREAALDGRGQLGAELLELLEALLEVGALHLQVVEPLLLGLVLLARERIDLAERDAAVLESLDASDELGAIVSLGGLDVSRRVEPPRRVRDVGVDPRDLDLRRP